MLQSAAQASASAAAAASAGATEQVCKYRRFSATVLLKPGDPDRDRRLDEA